MISSNRISSEVAVGVEEGAAAEEVQAGVAVASAGEAPVALEAEVEDLAQ